MLIAAIALGLVTLDPPIGVFHHGRWRGQCYRDGFLSGLDHELCTATLSGGVEVRLQRDADKLLIAALLPDCAGRQNPTSISSKSLSRPDRTRRVSRAIEDRIGNALKQCHGRTSAPSLSKRDLEATLKQTDGLIHLDPPLR